jgi:hypothetical protein
MDTELNPLNVSQQQIFKYLKDYHPNLFEDREEVNEIIISQANAAQQAFKDAIMQGKNGYEASEAANYALHNGYEFSPISYLQELYESKTGQYLEDDKACEILKHTREIFMRYGSDVEGSDEEANLIQELVPFFKLNLPEDDSEDVIFINGLQIV